MTFKMWVLNELFVIMNTTFTRCYYNTIEQLNAHIVQIRENPGNALIFTNEIDVGKWNLKFNDELRKKLSDL